MDSTTEKAVVTVIGIDTKGIIARVSGALYRDGINILDISQTVISGYFNMIMLVDITDMQRPFDEVRLDLDALGDRLGLQIRIQKSQIFEAMHEV